MLAGRGEHEASWEGAFGQMEALLAMETGTRGQYGEHSGPGSPADSKSVCGMGLMAFRGAQGGPGSMAYRPALPIDAPPDTGSYSAPLSLDSTSVRCG